MQPELVSYTADNLLMESCLYLPEAPARNGAAILVFPEGFGLGDHARTRAARLAQLGFVALACDLHGNGTTIAALDDVMQAIKPLHADSQRTSARARGGFDLLSRRAEVDPDRIAAIGFCFGGTMALELARSGAEVVATVGFHCGLATTRTQNAEIHGKVLVCIGSDDPVISPSERGDFEREMRAADVAWQMSLYGGVRHSFTNPAAAQFGHPELARYDATADAVSWREMLALFDDVFGEVRPKSTRQG
jgi:dienelactone hydrolase